MSGAVAAIICCCTTPADCWIKFTICECSIGGNRPEFIYIPCPLLTPDIQFVGVTPGDIPGGIDTGPTPPPGGEGGGTGEVNPLALICYQRTEPPVTTVPSGQPVVTVFQQILGCHECCNCYQRYIACAGGSDPIFTTCPPPGENNFIFALGECWIKQEQVATLPPGALTPTFIAIPDCEFCAPTCPSPGPLSPCSVPCPPTLSLIDSGGRISGGVQTTPGPCFGGCDYSIPGTSFWLEVPNHVIPLTLAPGGCYWTGSIDTNIPPGTVRFRGADGTNEPWGEPVFSGAILLCQTLPNGVAQYRIEHSLWGCYYVRNAQSNQCDPQGTYISTTGIAPGSGACPLPCCIMPNTLTVV